MFKKSLSLNPIFQKESSWVPRMMPLIHPSKKILFVLNRNLIKDKIPVLGIDIVDRHVQFIFSRRKTKPRIFPPNQFQQKQSQRLGPRQLVTGGLGPLTQMTDIHQFLSRKFSRCMMTRTRQYQEVHYDLLDFSIFFRNYPIHLMTRRKTFS